MGMAGRSRTMNSELQAVVEYMERERGIDSETMLSALEDALLSSSKKSMAPSQEIRVEIDRETYNIRAWAKMEVVQSGTNIQGQISLQRARRTHPDTVLGDSVEIEVDTKQFGRISAQTAKQAILHRLRQAEKDIIYEEYKDRPGDIVTGAVRRFDRSDVVVDLGRVEAVMPSRERVPTEEYQVGDRIRAYILNVDPNAHGPQIMLSRSHPDFVRRLFELEVSEIADTTVEIRSIAREAGFRSKVAVFSNDEKVDPVGACVGMRGIRVKNIVRELSGEKIDIVRWHEDIKTFVTNALAPARLLRVEISEALRSIKVVVDAAQLSLAIGKKGQNARLTAKLTGWKIDIEKNEEQIGFEEKVARAIKNLASIENVDEQQAEALVHAGFLTLEGIMAAEIGDLEILEGFTSEAARQVHQAAEIAHEKEHGKIEA